MINGAHVCTSISQENQIPFINRKGVSTRNLMVACIFDMQFLFFRARWECNAYDIHIFLEAINNPTIKFPKPPKGKYLTIINSYFYLKYVYSRFFFIKFVIIFLFIIAWKYYLVDVGYPNEYGYLSPYKGERYHFQDFQYQRQPTSRKERLSHAHSSFHNVIERAFVVWKQRWRIF